MKLNLLAAAAVVALASPTLAAELVSNGGFETGSFSSWTQFDNTGFTGVSGSFSGVNPTGGSFQAFFGPVGSTGGISQSIATVAGRTYTISFDVYAFGGGSVFEADFGGLTLLNNNFSDGLPYTTFTYTGVATGASTALVFTTEHDPAYYLLDNVSVTGAVPEPATWALMIGGFAMTGFAARRRRVVAA